MSWELLDKIEHSDLPLVWRLSRSNELICAEGRPWWRWRWEWISSRKGGMWWCGSASQWRASATARKYKSERVWLVYSVLVFWLH